MYRIVVGLDGSQKDRPLVHWTAEFADHVGAQVIVAHFVPRATVWMVAGAQLDSAQYIEELRDYFEREIIDPLRARDPLLHMHIQVGDPAHELAALARRSAADLIALGTRDHGILHDVVFGNVERNLRHRSDVPVVTVPYRTPNLHLVQ